MVKVTISINDGEREEGTREEGQERPGVRSVPMFYEVMGGHGTIDHRALFPTSRALSSVG
jgi:hypothetical protein